MEGALHSGRKIECSGHCRLGPGTPSLTGDACPGGVERAGGII